MSGSFTGRNQYALRIEPCVGDIHAGGGGVRPADDCTATTDAAAAYQRGQRVAQISVSLERQFPLDEEGNQREIYVPKFEHETAAQIVQKAKTSGEISEDFVLVIGRDGLPKMVSRDTDNLFDMVAREEAGNSGTADGSDI